MKAKVVVIIILILAYVLLVGRALAVAGPAVISAEAGNVTELTVGGAAATNNWAGFYGNISGIISLTNAEGDQLYGWGEDPTVAGEVFAANETVSGWSYVMCVNLSDKQPGFNCTGVNESCLNITEIEDYFNMSIYDAAGINETFNLTLPSITVGTVTLTNCSMTQLNNNNSEPSSDWNETILTINDTETIIFASIVNQDTLGFDNNTWDYQMIIGERGDDELTTTYYIYTELT